MEQKYLPSKNTFVTKLAPYKLSSSKIFSIFLGTEIHIDPCVTDAYNGLISGHKWWTYLPKDVLEFMKELKCDLTCSDTDGDSVFLTETWYHTIYPQLR